MVSGRFLTVFEMPPTIFLPTMSGSGYAHYWLQGHAVIADIRLLFNVIRALQRDGIRHGRVRPDTSWAMWGGIELRRQTSPPYKLPDCCCLQELWVSKWWWHACSIMTGCCRQGELACVSICHINARSEGCLIFLQWRQKERSVHVTWAAQHQPAKLKMHTRVSTRRWREVVCASGFMS